MQSIEEVRKKFSKIMNYTGSGRDINQLASVCALLKDEKTILFVGCSDGSEIIDFQQVLNDKDKLFFGIDVSEDMLKIASNKEYLSETRFVTIDLNKENVIKEIHSKTGYTNFDVVICRNMLIYYDDKTAQDITEKLASLTSSWLIIGMSDPVAFSIEDNSAVIGKHIFDIVDFDMKIFRRKV